MALGREVKPRRILRGLPRGYLITVSPEQNIGYLIGTAEPHLQRAIRQYVRAGDTVYDVGANMGYVTLTLARQVGARGRVAAFEPVAENLQKLRENVANNGLTNVSVFDVAASDQPGEAVIRMTGSSSMASMVWYKRDASAVEEKVKTAAIDDLVDSGALPENPTFVKIDVEGAEALVLRGMQRTIAAARPVLFIECSDAGREASWSQLRGADYECWSAVTGQRIDELERYRHADFLWLPRGRGQRK